MIDMTAPSTAEALSPTGARVHVPASGARLRTVVRRHLEQGATGPRELVAKHPRKLGPPGARDAPRAVTSYHSLDIELLDHDDAVALGKSRRLNMQEVLTLTPNFPVQTHHANLSLFSILRSFLASIDDALGMSKALHRSLVVFWIQRQIAVRVSKRVGDTAVDSDDWCSARRGFWYFDLTDSQDEPLVTIATKRAGLGLSFDGSMNNDSHVAKLREPKIIADNTPGFGVRLGDPKEVAPLSLPVWPMRKSLEAALPCLVEFCEQLSAGVAWHIGQPWKLSAEISQFQHLIKPCRVTLIGTRKTHESLLMREVPEEPQSISPLGGPLLLCASRVGTVAEHLVNQHDLEHTRSAGIFDLES